MKNHTLDIRTAKTSELSTLDAIRSRAFAPVFASFRALLGEELDAIVHASAEREQAALLASMFEPGSPWTVLVATSGDEVVGFASVRLDAATGVGELGLNAVDPPRAGQGVGTALYERALEMMRAAGMRAAVVGTGGDDSHAPARRAYEKVGFTRGVPSVWLARKL